MINKKKLFSAPIIKQCQSCFSADLRTLVFLGYFPLASAVFNNLYPQADEEIFYPLELLLCPQCSLVQLSCLVDQELLFPLSYSYRSRDDSWLQEHFTGLTSEAGDLLSIPRQDFVVDIGSNDGALLEHFRQRGAKVLGIEPSLASQTANGLGIHTLMEFFSSRVAGIIKKEYGQARLITAINVLDHVSDLADIFKGIADLLADDGILVGEVHYLKSLVQHQQYDTIYHEHRFYFSLSSLRQILYRHGLEIFYARTVDVRDGSLRFYACFRGKQPVSVKIDDLMADEARYNVSDGQTWDSWQSQNIRSRIELNRLLIHLKGNGSRVYGMGLPNRALTLIHFAGIDKGLLDCVLELEKSGKVGHRVPGTGIPIWSEEKLYQDQPEYALIFSPRQARFLISKLQQSGFRGKFIVPLVEPIIIT